MCALVIYLLASAIADLLVVDHLYSSIDARLAVRLSALAKEFPHGVSAVEPLEGDAASAGRDGDLDDAPILAWFVPPGNLSAQPLVSGAPRLPRREVNVTGPTAGRFGGRSFRLRGAAVGDGRIVVATSTQDVGSVRSTLLLIEGVLAPIVLLSLFTAATIIGRRAAGPIERERRRQLDFTADASHELRTPLSVIEAEVGLALSSARSATAYRAAIERVGGESKRLRSIVEDLLWLARLDSLPATPSHDAVDLVSLAQSCTARFEAIAEQKRLTIAVEADAGRPALVVAPPEWLDRLVSVLVDNACRYAEVGGRVVVTVAVRADRVTLAVEDSGPGIPPDERARVLQRFHRASDEPGGAGLGLAIADAVVRATNGEMAVVNGRLGGARIEASWSRYLNVNRFGEPSNHARGDMRSPSASTAP